MGEILDTIRELLFNSQRRGRSADFILLGSDDWREACREAEVLGMRSRGEQLYLEEFFGVKIIVVDEFENFIQLGHFPRSERIMPRPEFLRYDREEPVYDYRRAERAEQRRNNVQVNVNAVDSSSFNQSLQQATERMREVLRQAEAAALTGSLPKESKEEVSKE
jgi:hypothetical protein